MRVLIENDNENWRRWGDLVKSWIENPAAPRPTTTAELADTMKNHGIRGSIPGGAREVVIRDYSDTGPLYIMLPSKRMLDNELSKLKPGKPYPLPLFYAVAFGGATKVDLDKGETYAFAARRVGEYVIQECC